MPRPRFSNTNRRNNRQPPRIAGDVRLYQLVSSFGIGSIANFAKDTVIIAGVDDWDTNNNDRENWEDRKVYNENLQSITGAKFFLTPKANSDSRFSKSRDIPSYVFPEMLYCPKCKRLIHYKEAQNTGKPHQCFLNNQNGRPCKGRLVASRFVVCCENGHIEDFPYSWWVHRGAKCEKCPDDRKPRMSMFNAAGRSDAESLFVKCEDCGKQRNMEGAFQEFALAGENGRACSCNHPHLRDKKQNGESECGQPLKTRLRSSTGVYYTVAYSALSIPPWSKQAVQIVEREYDALQHMTGEGAVAYLSGKTNATTAIEQLLEAYTIIKARKGSSSARSEADVYYDEYKVLCGGDMESAGEYSAYAVDVPRGFENLFSGITVIDKLTVIQALKGFTRLKPWNGSANDDSDSAKRIAPLSTYKKDWLPAVKLNGEGVFFRFNEKTLKHWVSVIGNRYGEMRNALGDSFYRGSNPRFSEQYVALHTFAHLMIRQLANDCGYSASSLREKIYSTYNGNGDEMCGVLIYLAASDADGSLGGLISIAENTSMLQNVLEEMLRKAQWCSADPLCITSKKQGFLSLNYAACHDCVLLPETSCEFRNVLLDRAAIVGTPEDTSLGLFSGMFMPPTLDFSSQNF
jgi:hypothetical protein